MARGLAKLEGELARVGSWAATRRERQEAARYDVVRFPNPLATGSGLGFQCPKKWELFL